MSQFYPFYREKHLERCNAAKGVGLKQWEVKMVYKLDDDDDDENDGFDYDPDE